MFHNRLCHILISLQVLFAQVALSAALDDLTSGMHEALNIGAAHLEIDNLQGIATYSGDVTLTMGDRQLKCDKLVIYRVQPPAQEEAKTPKKEEDDNGMGGKIARVIAYGKPVGYAGPVEGKPDIIHAFADVMEYDLEKQIFYLRENARIEQGKNLYEAPEIQYDLANEIITSSPSNKGRVHMVIDAETLSGSTGNGSLEDL